MYLILGDCFIIFSNIFLTAIDVAILYNYTTKRINETVRRNIARFLENFCFQLTEKEVEDLRSQNATASKKENKNK